MTSRLSRLLIAHCSAGNWCFYLYVSRLAKKRFLQLSLKAIKNDWSKIVTDLRAEILYKVFMF